MWISQFCKFWFQNCTPELRANFIRMFKFIFSLTGRKYNLTPAWTCSLKMYFSLNLLKPVFVLIPNTLPGFICISYKRSLSISITCLEEVIVPKSSIWTFIRDWGNIDVIWFLIMFVLIPVVVFKSSYSSILIVMAITCIDQTFLLLLLFAFPFFQAYRLLEQNSQEAMKSLPGIDLNSEQLLYVNFAQVTYPYTERLKRNLRVCEQYQTYIWRGKYYTLLVEKPTIISWY